MKIEIVLTYIFIIMVCGLPIEIMAENGGWKWESVSGPFYRPGYWWTIYMTSPVDFPGSSQMLRASLDNFHVSIEGTATKSPKMFGYFLVASVLPKLSLKVCQSGLALVPERDAGREDKMKFQKSESVEKIQCLAPDDILIGIYGFSQSSDQLFALSMDTQERIYFQHIVAIPEQWESLKVFNVIIWNREDCPPSDLEVVRKWVVAGGNLFFLQPQIANKREFVNWILQSKKSQDTPELTYARFGLGKLGYLKEICGYNSREQWLHIWSEISKSWRDNTRMETDVIPEFTGIFKPPCWGKKARYQLYVLSSLCVLICLCVWRLISNSPRIKSGLIPIGKSGNGVPPLFFQLIPITLLIIGAFTCLVYLNLARFIPVDYQRLSITRLVRDANDGLQTDYHYFQSLRDREFSYYFDELPLPILRDWEELSAMEIYLTRHRAEWEVRVPCFIQNQSGIWQTQKIHSWPGKLRVEMADNVWQVTNHTAIALAESLYLHQTQIFSCGNLAPGDTIRIPLVPSSQLHSIYNLPEKWMHRDNLVKWISNNFSEVLVLAYGPYYPPAKSREFANYRHYHIGYFRL